MNTNETIYTLSEIKDIVRPVAERHHIRTLTLFGSYARGEADASSDIDLCVDGESIRSLLDLGDSTQTSRELSENPSTLSR